MKASFVHICPAKAIQSQKIIQQMCCTIVSTSTNPTNSYYYKAVLFQLQPTYSLLNNFQIFTAGFHKNVLITEYVN